MSEKNNGVPEKNSADVPESIVASAGHSIETETEAETETGAKAGVEPPAGSSAPSLGGAKAYAVWGVAMAGYIFAVTCRSSLSATGIEAAHHFDTTSTALSMFLYLQLFVYAIMQIPAGVLLDRFGARRLIAAGGILMSFGQALMAVAPATSIAVIGRGIVGMGDAMTFISVIRLVSAWFPFERVPLMNQITSMLGGLGQIISIYPFVWLLRLAGWQIAFLSLTAIGVMIAACVIMSVRDTPAAARRTPGAAENHADRTDRTDHADHANRDGLGSALRGLKAVLKTPGTFCGFWVHSTTWFSINMMNQLWGVPFLLAVEGYSREQASAYLAIGMVINVVWALSMGRIAGLHPIHGRAAIVYATVGSQALCWTILLLTPGPHPTWFMVLLLLAMSSGGPASNIAFDFARDTNRPDNLGAATGFANTGGFLSSALIFLGVGMMLDAQGATDPSLYTDHVMRIAVLIQYPMWIIGLTGFTVMLPKTTRILRARFHR
ncbi:permease of the major facilitator superfamily [Bifidobacterium margollesii]|uniref:Permease of the major facilitator superfamily n=1 Tax=Bifidobacterium margollesii TaxID=2020964 RepID=A0A2N5JD01_9BIFI|nr:MFS transporter [Bifidobacterium margollesii]PLS32069.1 permease of the major facilitator superfamily [Bifidobacterium margollesii]